MSEDVSIGKADVSVRQQFENARDLQAYWADNAVSITITFKDDEADQLHSLLEEFAPEMKAVSLLPHMDDLSMPQAPYISISQEQYNDICSKVTKTPVSLSTSPI